ncbi:hypothetical protein ACFLXE_04570 [Chloroflexota bacterium]
MDDPWDWYLENLVIGNIIIGLVFVPIFIYGIWWSIKLMFEREGSQAGERYGNGSHAWQVIVNNNKHLVTLDAGWRKDTLMLDGTVVERGKKDYKFQIEGEPALLTTRESLEHGSVHRLFVSGRLVQ